MPTLADPYVTKYGGAPALSADYDAVGALSWGASVTLTEDDSDGLQEEDTFTVGVVTFLTARLDPLLPELLDAISGDMAAFAPLFDQDFIVDELQEQFEDSYPAGILILDQAHLHPAVRGHDLGAWSVAQIINNMTFGRDLLVLTHPSPPGEQNLPETELRRAQNHLARYWEKAGLVRLDAAPHLMGQSTVYTRLDEARAALTPVAEVRIEVDVAAMAELRRGWSPFRRA